MVLGGSDEGRWWWDGRGWVPAEPTHLAPGWSRGGLIAIGSDLGGRISRRIASSAERLGCAPTHSWSRPLTRLTVIASRWVAARPRQPGCSGRPAK